MKKLFAILAIAAMFVACNHNESVVIEEPVVDSTEAMDSIPNLVCDSICDSIGIVEE